MKNVLFVVSSCSKKGKNKDGGGFYLSELTHPYDVLSKTGANLIIASPKGKKAPIDKESIDLKDEINKKYYNDDNFIKLINNTKKLDEIDPFSLSAVFFAGGHGAMFDFSSDKNIKNLIKSLFDNNGIVASVCHGASALVDIKMNDGSYFVKGKNLTSFTNSEEKEIKMEDEMPYLLESKLVEQGAIFNSKENWQENVVVDNNLITGQNPKSAKKVAQEIVKKLFN